MKRLKFIVAKDSCLQNSQQNLIQCQRIWKIYRISAKPLPSGIFGKPRIHEYFLCNEVKTKQEFRVNF